MSEEEIKAIDYLQLCYDISTIDNESLPKLGIVLNLIEKQVQLINLMAEDLTTDYHSKEWVIKNYEEKVK